jgi:hypothetical protein
MFVLFYSGLYGYGVNEMMTSYAKEEEAKLIESHGGNLGTTKCNVERGREAFLRGVSYMPSQTEEWRYGWSSEQLKFIRRVS